MILDVGFVIAATVGGIVSSNFGVKFEANPLENGRNGWLKGDEA